MPQGEHSHYDKYITRIVKRERISASEEPAEFIQFICEADGEIFREQKIMDRAINN